MGVLALLLQACASYEPSVYGPIRSAEYYAENDEYSTAFEEATPDVSISFADAAQYPWWSMDYYYLGSHAYRPHYWAGPRYALGYRFGHPAGFWPYYGFYSPFYYPYSTYAWYDPWYGWPRYGIGTNLFWLEYSAWASRNNYSAVTRENRYGRSVYRNRDNGSSLYPDYRNYNDAFYDARDRSGTRPEQAPGQSAITGTRSGTMQVRRRADTKIRQSHTGTVSPASSPGISRQSSRSVTRPSASTARPSPVPRVQSPVNARTSTPVKKRKN